MEIVRIFAPRLYSFKYDDNDSTSELRRLLNLWQDAEYIFEFIEEHKSDIPKKENKEELSSKLMDYADDLGDTVLSLAESPLSNLDEVFSTLNNQEGWQAVELSKQKGRNRYIRLYAIKIDTNCFVITGGAIKFHHLMEHREHTKKELVKLDKCQSYLKANGVFDSDSFHEFLNED